MELECEQFAALTHPKGIAKKFEYSPGKVVNTAKASPSVKELLMTSRAATMKAPDASDEETSPSTEATTTTTAASE